ncbi:hypothetical protein SAY86_004599 [Trapa natans]|uniref:Leucine-rich repeat-containing N-terminal plant-type domain-containing protein n=1 Tax=Trapa natans TaxID=22666 RepID=A0AAN7RI29_TRANT|nr:hypothetical protein SAY86_004599 [Trapa natans]
MRASNCLSQVLQAIILSMFLSQCFIASRAFSVAPLIKPPPPSRNSSRSSSECDALLQFSNSLTVTWDASYVYCDYPTNTSYPKTASWKKGTDCCSWDGVICDTMKHVIGLDLMCSWLQGVIHSNSTLFSLSNLRQLNLARNNFSGSRISSRFGILTRLAHLNLTYSGFSGRSMKMISRHLPKLISLGLTDTSNDIDDHTFRLFANNLTQLRELSLYFTNMSRVSPLSFTNLSSTMMHLTIYNCVMKGVFPFHIFHFPNLRSLSLSYNDNFELMGTFPHNLTQLRELFLSHINMTRVSPMSFANLSSTLTQLTITECDLRGVFPFDLFHLPNLRRLTISKNNRLGSTLPHTDWTLGSSDHLTHLDLSLNHFFNTSLNFGMFAGYKNLQYFSLSNSHLNISMPSDGNYSFPRLRVLDLSYCYLTKLPDSMSFDELSILDLSYTGLSGHIPEWIWRGPRETLTTLNLQSNNLSGEISSSLCQMSSLEDLLLNSNKVDGTIPGCLGNITHLVQLDLSYNQLHGTLPRSLSSCSWLSSLSVAYNRIYDIFPHWVNASYDLTSLSLESNKFYGVIGAPPLRIEELFLGENHFSGQLPANFTSVNSIMERMDISKNMFEGPPPIPPPIVTYYDISHNKFVGNIPRQLCNATRLEIMDVSFNKLSGTIPPCLINVTATMYLLNLQANHFVGQIPDIFAPQNRLFVIQLSQNHLSGKLPRTLSHCDQLIFLDLSRNGLDDSFPSWLETCQMLQVLSLKSNKLHGPVIGPNTTNNPFHELHIFDLSENIFSGPLPHNYIMSSRAMKIQESHSSQLYIYQGPYADKFVSITMDIKGSNIKMEKLLTLLFSIDLSSNLFKGEIPSDIGDLKGLKALNFSHNNLSGSIPPSMGNLANLESLDLSSNKLNGKIPEGLAKLAQLSWLNLSNNQLVGQIPRSTQFDTFNHSFDGNPDLCGHPLPSQCVNINAHPPSTISHGVEEAESHRWIEWRATPIGCACGLMFGIWAGCIMVEKRRPR